MIAEGKAKALNVTIWRNASAVACAVPPLAGSRRLAAADPSTPVFTVAGVMLAPGEARNATGIHDSGLPESSRKITLSGEARIEPGRPVCASPEAFTKVNFASATALILYKPSATVVALLASTT